MEGLILYEIKIGEAIGKAKIGMKRDEVRSLFDDLEEWRETPYGYDHEVVYDSNDEFQIYYDENDCVNFILCTAMDEMSMDGKKLNEDLFYDDLLAAAQELTSDIVEDEVGFTSNQLGFGACAYYDEDEPDDVVQVENVQVAVKNYW